MREHSNRRVSRLGDQVADAVVDVALSKIADFEHSVGDRFGEIECPPKIRDDLVIEEPFQFVRDAGQCDDTPIRVVDDERRRRTVRVVHGDSPLRNICLALIVRRHDEASPAKSPLDVL